MLCIVNAYSARSVSDLAEKIKIILWHVNICVRRRDGVQLML